MRTIFTDIKNKVTCVMDLDGLEDFTSYLNCENFEVEEILINSRRYAVISSADEGFKNTAVSAEDDFGNAIFYGNLIITKLNDYGYMVPLSMADVEHIKKCISVDWWTDFAPVLTKCERLYQAFIRRA